MQKLAKHSIHYINKKNFLLIYIKTKTSIFIKQIIKNGFLVTKFMPIDLEHMLLLRIIINYKILLLLTTLQEITWTSKTLYTIIQLKK